jgi:hypothetical protein
VVMPMIMLSYYQPETCQWSHEKIIPNTVITHHIIGFETSVKMLQTFHTLWWNKAGALSQVPHKREVCPHPFWQTSHSTQLRHKVDKSVMPTLAFTQLWHWHQHRLRPVLYFHLIFLNKIEHSIKTLEASFLAWPSVNENKSKRSFIYSHIKHGKVGFDTVKSNCIKL